MGSRMPSRQSSTAAPPPGVRMGSVDSSNIGPTDHQPINHLETIQSVQTSSGENIATTTLNHAFTQEQLEEAMKKAGAA
jgi:hypothetical protein